MEWSEVKIDTAPEGLDILCDSLTALGVESFSIEDEGEFLSFLQENRRSWDYVDEGLLDSMRGVCRVTFYLNPADFETLEAVRSRLASLREKNPDTGLGSLRITVNSRDEEEWAESWMQYYKPMEAGTRLFIRPEWEEAETPPGRVALITNPGMAFGTGTHASTRLCLELIDGCIRGGERVIDLGCGSGILSVAALLLGAETAAGVDIDPNAAEISERNAALNGLGDKYSAAAGDVLNDAKLIKRLSAMGADVIFSNIVADVIIALCPVYKKIAPGGTLIASGVIDTREEDVRSALAAAGIEEREIRRQDGWTAFLCRIQG